MSIRHNEKNGRTAGAQRHLVRPSCTNHLQSHAEETHGSACSKDQQHTQPEVCHVIIQSLMIFTANSWSVSGVHLLIHRLVLLVEDLYMACGSISSPTHPPTGHPVERRMANKWMPSAGIWRFLTTLTLFSKQTNGSGKLRKLDMLETNSILQGEKPWCSWNHIEL